MHFAQVKQSSRQGRRSPASAGKHPSAVERTLRGSGEALDGVTQRLAAAEFGHDFSQVRVHADAGADEAARQVNALAFAVGNHVVFRRDRFAPGTRAGAELLGHELAHVVQQRRYGIRLQRRPPWMLDEPMEREADEFGGRLGRRRRPGSTLTYREARELVLPPRPRPPAAQLRDTTARVLPAERPMFEDLRTFIASLPARLRALVTAGSASDPWLRADNPNVQGALRTLDALVADLNGERFILRFDQPAGQSAAASYDSLNNVMHLKTFANDRERASISIDLVHEYTHRLQDVAEQQTFARQRRPSVRTREEDLQREIGARREQVYFAELIRVLGVRRPDSEIFGTQLSDMVFRGRFEQERAGATARERRAATREIRSSIETPYQAQLQTNSSIKSYIIELSEQNRALLHWDLAGISSPRDLGEIPRTLTSTGGLNATLERLVRVLPEFNLLFDRPGGQRFNIVTFTVTFDGEQISEFGVQAP